MKLEIFGSVQRVIEGKVSLETLEHFSLSDIAYGLGAVTTFEEGRLLVGEGLVCKGAGYGYAPEKTWTMHEEIKTPFFVGIKHLPKHLISATHYPSVDAMYATLIEQFPNGAVIVGEGKFKCLSLAYLAISPTTGESVLNSKAICHHQVDNQEATIFGLVMPKSDSRLFYKNPREKCHSVPYYTHTQALVDGVPYHLLNQSTIDTISLHVEHID